jgi:hypothetical protein
MSDRAYRAYKESQADLREEEERLIWEAEVNATCSCTWAAGDDRHKYSPRPSVAPLKMCDWHRSYMSTAAAVAEEEFVTTKKEMAKKTFLRKRR